MASPFGRKLRQLMHEKGWSEADLGEFVGLSQASISKYINGTRMPYVSHLRKIEKALSVPCGTLYKLVPPKFVENS